MSIHYENHDDRIEVEHAGKTLGVMPLDQLIDLIIEELDEYTERDSVHEGYRFRGKQTA